MGGMTSLLLLLWIGVTVSTVVDLHKRVQGGYDCPAGERLFHVKLVDQNNNLLCGGSLINNQWILTAAHCWEWGMQAVLNAHPGPEHPPVEITNHPVIYVDDQNRIHDIMLLKLPAPTAVQNFVTLPTCPGGQAPSLPVGAGIQVGGFGPRIKDPNNPHPPSPTLRCADFNVDQCVHPTWPYLHLLCGQINPPVDTCPGDSGGAWLHNNMIYGVHHGAGQYACTFPPKFSDVCKYLDWIICVTRPPPPPPPPNAPRQSWWSRLASCVLGSPVRP